MAQLDYNDPSSGQAGDLGYSNGNKHLVLSYNVVTGGLVKPGLGVVKIAGDENGMKLPDASNAQVIGVATRDTSEENTDDSSFTYSANSMVGVCRRGQIWVTVEENVTPDDAVFVRFDGEHEVFTLTFDADAVTGNSIACTIDGEALSATPFNTSHLQTMQDLAAKIQALDSVATATVGGGGNRVITVTGATDGNEMSTGSSVTVTGGASQANVAVASVTGPSVGTQKGIFRTDADTGAAATAVALPNCKFLTDGSAGGVALLDLNIA